MESITFKSADIDQVLKEFVDGFSKPNSVNADVIPNAMRQAIYENFVDEYGDGNWKPLAPATVKDRIRKGFSGTNPILQRTESLLNSLINPNNSDHIEETMVSGSGWTVDVGSNDERTPWLDQGTDDGHIPARPFLTMDARQEDRLAAAVEAYFDSLF